MRTCRVIAVTALLVVAQMALGVGAGRANAQVGGVNLLDVSFMTIFRTESGREITRIHRALPLLPISLNVDDNPVPDLVATVSVGGLDQISFTTRTLSSVRPFRLQIEAIVRSPLLLRGLPRERVTFGYDARVAGAPPAFSANLRFPLLAGIVGGSKIDMFFGGIERREAMTLIAGLFDGDPVSRLNPISGTFRYIPMPSGGSISLDVRPDGYEVRLGNADPEVGTSVTPEILMIENVARRAVHVTGAVGLPRQSTLLLDYSRSRDGNFTLIAEPTFNGSDPPLHTGLLVDARFDQGIGRPPLAVNGTFQLPEGRTTVTRETGKVRYAAAAPGASVHLRVTGMGPPVGSVFLNAQSLPRQFTFHDGSVEVEGTKHLGIADIPEGESIGSIDLRAWDARVEPQDPALGYDSRDSNFIEVIRGDAPPELSARAHLEQVARAIVSVRPESTNIGVTFDTERPRPLVADIDLETGRNRVKLKAYIAEPPPSLDATVFSEMGPRIELLSAQPIPSATVRFWAQNQTRNRPEWTSLGGALRLQEIPRFVAFCASGGATLCDPDAPTEFPHTADGRRFALANDLNVSVETSPGEEPMRVDGVICLPRGTSRREGADRCLDRAVDPMTTDSSPTGRGLVLRSVRLRELDFEYGSGNSTAASEDDLLKLWLHIPQRGITFEAVRYHDGTPGRDPATDLILANTGRATTADRFVLLADLSGVPNVEYSDGRFTCGGLVVAAKLPLVTRVPVLGPIPGVPATIRSLVCSDY